MLRVENSINRRASYNFNADEFRNLGAFEFFFNYRKNVFKLTFKLLIKQLRLQKYESNPKISPISKLQLFKMIWN